MTDYKILQNIDLAQNEIKEVSKISNDRVDDGSKKYIIIQTGDDTTLTLASKEGNAFNFIESNTEGKASSDEASLSSDIKSTPESIDIVHKRTDKSNKSEESKISLHSNAYTAESDKRNHILVQSPLVDIQTGESTEYDDSSIKLSKKNGNTLGDMSLKSNEITLSGGTDSLNSNISIEDKSINASSKNIKLSSNDTTSAVLTLNQDAQTILSSAGKEIKKTVGEVSISLKKDTKDTSSQSITLSNAVESSSSKIEVNNSNVKISKGDNSYTEVNSNNLTGVSREISLATSKNTPDVSLILNNEYLFAKLTSSGTITLTSQNEAKTEYGNNSITSTADTILFKTKGYTSSASSYPHIELESNSDKRTILVEGKNISISSADESTSNKTDSVNVTGTALNIGSTTTNITSNTVNINNGGDPVLPVLTLDVTNKKISVPPGTETDFDSDTIGIGSANSNTTIEGTSFTIGENTTTKINGSTAINGSTTISNGGNTVTVGNQGTQVTGDTATINPTKVNIGTDTTTSIYIGSTSTSTQNTTTLQSNTTEVTSPTLNVSSKKISFENTETQNVTFEGGTKGGTVKSTVPTFVENTTFTVKTEKDTTTSVLEVSAPDLTTKISGTSATINPTKVNIGTDTTTSIYIGSTSTSTQNTTTLQSNTTNITSANINIGNSGNETIKLGTLTSTVSITGNNGLSLTSGTSETPKSEIASTNMKFTDSLYCNDKVRIYWDSTLQSLVFGRV